LLLASIYFATLIVPVLIIVALVVFGRRNPQAYWSVSVWMVAVLLPFSLWTWYAIGESVLSSVTATVVTAISLLATSYLAGYDAQSIDRARTAPFSQAIELRGRVKYSSTRALSGLSRFRPWERYVVPSGTAETAHGMRLRAHLTLHALILLSMGLVLFAFRFPALARVQSAFALVSVAAFWALMLQRRVQLAGELKAVGDESAFLAIDPIRPWLGEFRISADSRCVAFGGSDWVAVPHSADSRLVLVATRSTVGCAVRLSGWSRFALLWFGCRPACLTMASSGRP